MSLRGRLTLWLLLAVVPVVCAAHAGLYLFVRSALMGRFDDALRARAEAIRGVVRLEGAGTDRERIELDVADEAMPQFERGGSECFEVWHIDPATGTDGLGVGSSVVRSGSLETESHAPLPPSPETVIWDGPLSLQKAHAWSSQGRFMAIGFDAYADPDTVHEGEVHLGRPVLLVVGKDRAELDRTLGLIGLGLLGAGVLVVVTVAGAVRLVLGRGLRSVDDLAARVEAIGPAELSRRVGGPNSGALPRELRPIARGIDGLLERLGLAFSREQRLAASAAHELRTPLAEARAAAELALSRERSGEEYRAALGVVVDATERMSESTDAVLRLARVQSGREALSPGAVDLHAVVTAAWRRRIEPLVARGVSASFAVPAGTAARADAAMVGVLFDNLLANAAEHTPRGGWVRVSCTVEAGVVVCVVANAAASGQAVELSAAPAPPHTGALHAGLGLVIAREIAQAHGGSCAILAAVDRFTATVRLPGV